MILFSYSRLSHFLSTLYMYLLFYCTTYTPYKLHEKFSSKKSSIKFPFRIILYTRTVRARLQGAAPHAHYKN